MGTAAGAITQLKECTAQLVRFAKSSGVSVIIVGHVTKDGAIAGPRVLEHLVDTVLYFESDASSRFRNVRATKNRFGSVGELAFFHMGESGLREVRNPSAIFLARSGAPAPGSIVTVTRDGRRPLLVELQALVDRMRFGSPRRVAQGLDAQRIAMLLAVMNRHAGVSLQEHDVFVNLVGGLEVTETACDLPVALALASSLADKPIAQQMVAFGEIGLTGELRPVAYGEERLREAAKQGFNIALIPKDNAPRTPIEGLRVHEFTRIDEALKLALALNAALSDGAGRRRFRRGRQPCARARTVRMVFSPICSTSNWYSPTSTRSPASGRVSSCSTSKPFSVFGPSVGSCHPSERLTARIVALALMMKTPGASRCTCLCVTVAGSVVNSPTISSRMSSSVTKPWMSPYSSTTNARRRRLRWNWLSCMVSDVPSGTK